MSVPGNAATLGKECIYSDNSMEPFAIGDILVTGTIHETRRVKVVYNGAGGTRKRKDELYVEDLDSGKAYWNHRNWFKKDKFLNSMKPKEVNE